MIYELNGVKYLQVDIPVTSKNAKKVEYTVKKHGGLYQSIRDIHAGGFFSSFYCVGSYLIPEKNIIAFNEESL